MKAIVAVDKNWAIGYHGSLLVQIPEDMKFFKEKTANNVIVVGRKTLESFPGGKALKDRINVVLTRDTKYKADNCVVVYSVPEAVDMAKRYEKYTDKEVFVVGGAEIYNQLLPYCDTVYATKIDNSFEADTWFPNLDENAQWTIRKIIKEGQHNGVLYQILEYSVKVMSR